jgi:NAD(P)-dependent dehydrogenase (short-subunit alcohol dehydrogenase family)
VACVTGATRGIGKGIAIGLAEAGATVYITGRSSGDYITESDLGGTLENVVSEIEKVGGKGIAIKCDHKNDHEVLSVFEKIQNDHGKLDILVNNVFQTPSNPKGDKDPDLLFRNFWDQPGWFWDSFMNIGLRSHYISTCFAFPLLKSSKESNINTSPLIIHISSFGGISYSFNVAYGVGKAGVDRMARDMALELQPYGINCISLYPGVVQTERMSGFISSGEWRKKTNLATPSSFLESPILTGRVIAELYARLDAKLLSRNDYNGKVKVVAELAKIFGVTDLQGNLPPSIRSVKFLLPSLILNNFKTPPQYLEDFLVKYTPDILLPMFIMQGGPPSSSKS